MKNHVVTALTVKSLWRSSRLIAALVVLASSAMITVAQDKVPKRGFNPGGSYALSDIESINTSNGNLSLRVPLGSLPAGPAGLAASLGLTYNSKLYDSFVGVAAPVSITQLTTSPYGGWRYGFDYQLHNLIRQDYQLYTCPDERADPHFKLLVSFPDGSTHEFRPVGFPGGGDGYYTIRSDGFSYYCPGGGSFVVTTGMHYYSTDGTYMRLDVAYDGDSDPSNNPWTLSLPDGSQVTGQNTARQFYDRNGNQIRFRNITLPNGHPATDIFDYPMSRAMVIEYSSNGLDYIHFKGSNGEDLTYTVTWRNIRADTYQSLGSDGVTYTYGMPSVTVVDQIALPTQAGALSYTLGYNTATTFCEVASITLPSGARADYTYQYGSQALYVDQVMENHITTKSQAYNLEYDGTSTPTTEQWSYIIPPSNQGGQSTITGPDGGLLHEWSYANQNNPATDWSAGLVYKSERPDGTVVERLWAPNIPYNPLGTGPMNAYLKTEFTSIKNAAGTLTRTAITDFAHDKNGNVTQVADYDWVDYATVTRDQTTGLPTGVPAGLTPKRVTVKTYYSPTPDAGDSTTNNPNAYQQTTAPPLRSAIESGEVRSGFPGSQALSRDEFFYDNVTTTGNLTTKKMWDSTQGGITRPLTATNSISITNQYDAYGNLTLATDARGTQTQFTYGSVGGFTNLYPTQIVAAFGTTIARTTNKEYDFNTGLATRVTDFDNNVATATTYDAFGRPKLVKAAEGKPEEADTATSYDDTARRVILSRDLNTRGDGKLVTIEHYDQLGRLRLSRRLEDASTQSATDETTGIKVQTRYRYTGTNSYQVTSSPYRATLSSLAGSEQTMGWTRTMRDSGGRVVEVQTFGGSDLPPPWGTNGSSSGSATTSYDAEFTTLTDQAGHTRKSASDGLGRLSGLTEDPSANNYQTSYTYDARGSLLGVAQGIQTRTYTYDSLSRLHTAQNPEQVNTSGTQVATIYGYDNNGNLLSKQNPAGTSVGYSYDGLNRVASKTLSTGPIFDYAYDTVSVGKGRLASVKLRATSGSQLQGDGYIYDGYDAMGRATSAHQVTAGTPYPFTNGYDLAGDMTSEQYPSGRTITTTFDSAARVNGVTGSLAGVTTTYASSFTYTAHSEMSAMKFGGTGVNLWVNASFNSRLQPTTMGAGAASGDYSKLKLDYTYGLLINGTLDTTKNNGNIQSQTMTVGSAILAQSYLYDALNRLTSAQESLNTTGRWTQTYGYDQYGNRTSLSNSGTDALALPTQSTPAIDATTNRLVGFAYDTSGNVRTDPSANTFSYDAENHQVTASQGSSSYTYDGDGRRVTKTTGGVSTVFVYDVGGRLVAEYGGPQGTNGGTSYFTTDHLGSTRLVMDSQGNVRARHDYMPFGEEVSVGIGGRTTGQGYGGSDDTRQKFTSKERDNESGLDYFEARYYSAALGRFTTCDPLVSSGKAADPQTWNRFAYTSDRPLTYVDPTGLIWGLSLDGTIKWYKDKQALEDARATEWTQWVYHTKEGFWVRLEANGPSANNKGWEAYATEGEAVEGRHGSLGDSSTPMDQALDITMADTGGRVVHGFFKWMLGGVAARAATEVASGAGGETAEMTVVRIIERGEKIDDIVNEAKGLTLTSGNEHAVVTLANGERALVSGGEFGIRFPPGEITRIFGHTHPFHFPASGPSAVDRAALESLCQRSSYLLEHGQLTKFGR